MVLASPSAPASAAEVLVGNKLSNKKKLRAAGSLFEELVKVFFRSGGAFSSCIEAAGVCALRQRKKVAYSD